MKDFILSFSMMGLLLLWDFLKNQPSVLCQVFAIILGAFIIGLAVIAIKDILNI